MKLNFFWFFLNQRKGRDERLSATRNEEMKDEVPLHPPPSREDVSTSKYTHYI